MKTTLNLKKTNQTNNNNVPDINYRPGLKTIAIFWLEILLRKFYIVLYVSSTLQSFLFFLHTIKSFEIQRKTI